MNETMCLCCLIFAFPEMIGSVLFHGFAVWQDQDNPDLLGEGRRSHVVAFACRDFAWPGIKAWNKEDNIMGSAQAGLQICFVKVSRIWKSQVPQGTLNKHVDLFRRLQCKWQCFDAYARVCMALGANQHLGLHFFLGLSGGGVTVQRALSLGSSLGCSTIW